MQPARPKVVGAAIIGAIALAWPAAAVLVETLRHRLWFGHFSVRDAR